VNIVEAGNTLDGYPLRILRHRGFVVFYPPNSATESYEGLDVWALHPNGTRLVASNCLALLGLLSILDHLGDNWYTEPAVDLKSVSMRHPYPIDLGPGALAELDEDEIGENIEAFMLFCRSEQPGTERPMSRDDLVRASQRFLDLEAEAIRRAEEED